MALILILFATVWLMQLSHASLSAPADNIEQLTWVRAAEWGYYKHPPLPTWLLWLPVQIFGVTAWTSYALAAAFAIASMGILWHLLLKLRGRQYATLALLAVLCITYYNGRLYYYNHNTVLLLISTACAALCWQAWSTGQRRWWAALGAAVGLGMLTKYHIAVTVACVVVFWLSQRGWRDERQRCGLLLAAFISLLIFVPHILWLRTHDFAPIQYAIESSLGARLDFSKRLFVTANWLLDQLLNRALMAWVLLATALYWSNRELAGRSTALTAFADANQNPGSRALLMSWGLVPLAFMPLLNIATGSELQMPWGTSFLHFAVSAVMEIAKPRVKWFQLPLRPTLVIFTFIQGFLLILNHVTSPRGPAAFQDHYWRAFDSQALASQVFPKIYSASASAPICVISGSPIIAGALALVLPNHPLVLIDGRLDRSPWLNPATLSRCGVLHIGQGIPEPGGELIGTQFPGLWWRVSSPGRSPPPTISGRAP